MGEDTGMAYLTVSLQLFLEMPNHPGLAHYIIHSYDVLSLINIRPRLKTGTYAPSSPRSQGGAPA